MFIKASRSTISVLVFCLLVSCSRKPEFATSAVATDFDGRWSGAWNWDPTRSTSLELSGTEFKVTGLPIEKSPDDKLVTVSGKGEARFQSQYGSKGAPCVLLYFPDHKEVIPVFISREKSHLIYTVDINLDRRIIFTRN
jgi:hypothetical protein